MAHNRDLMKMAAGWSAGVLGRLLPPRTPRAGVLLYHRTCPAPPGAPPPSWNVTPERMRAQLTGLKKRGFWFLPLEEVLEELQAGRPFPRGGVTVTFDDGYENNFEHAVPVLRELEVPACFFVATAYLDSRRPLPFDQWALSQEDRVPLASWQPLRRESLLSMRDDPLFSIGSHTHTHPIGRTHNEDFEADLAQSLRILQDLEITQPAFAFPAGRQRLGYFSPQMLASARRLGVQCAMTTDGASPLHSADGFVVGRFNVFQWDTPFTLEGKLAGWFDWAPRMQEWVNCRGKTAPLETELA